MVMIAIFSFFTNGNTFSKTFRFTPKTPNVAEKKISNTLVTRSMIDFMIPFIIKPTYTLLSKCETE